MTPLESMFGWFGVLLTALGAFLALKKMERVEIEENRELMKALARDVTAIILLAVQQFEKKGSDKSPEHAAFIRDHIFANVYTDGDCLVFPNQLVNGERIDFYLPIPVGINCEEAAQALMQVMSVYSQPTPPAPTH